MDKGEDFIVCGISADAACGDVNLHGNLDPLRYREGKIVSKTGPDVAGQRLAALWSTNVTKMHFQQSICFQLRAWALGITGVVLPLLYKIDDCTPETKSLLHLFLFLIVLLILHKDLSWHRYFWKYHERAKKCEKALTESGQWSGDYWRGDKIDTRMTLLIRDGLKRVHTLSTDYIEIYLLIIIAISYFYTKYKLLIVISERGAL